MGTCCSSENPALTAEQNTQARQRLVDKPDRSDDDIEEAPKSVAAPPEEEIPDESVSKAESPKSSIFEQLQVAENEAIQENSNNDKNNDLGLAPVTRNDTTEAINNPVDRTTGVQSQPSYADAEAGINKNAHKLKKSAFSMLQFISTSPTLKDDESFNVTQQCQELKEAFESKKGKELGAAVGGILTRLSERQRLQVVDTFVGANGENLKGLILDKFSGDTASVLTELCRSSAANDAYWIRQSLTKSSPNTSLLSEILCSRTNEQIQEISRAYFSTYSVSLEDALKKSFAKSGKSYVSLMTQILGFTRVESATINEKSVRTDIRRIYTWLEETNNWEKNKQAIVDLFAKRSWQHINAICDKYTTKSMHDLQTLLHKKLGTSSKTGEALQVIIQIARDRFAYFANLLHKAMKGLGTHDTLLIRTVVSRSGIDLKEIIDRFSRDFGEGKTIVQWIKGDTTGVYQFIILSICNLDDASLDKTEQYEAADYRRRTIIASGGTVTGSAGAGGDESESKGDDGGQGGHGREESKIQLESMSNEDWDEYWASSPTVRIDSSFQPVTMADYLHGNLTTKDKKKKKKNKEIVIQAITNLTNDQRQTLFETYRSRFEGRNLGQDIKDALGNKGKGKSLYAVLVLLQTPAHQDADVCRKAIKNGDFKMLAEILGTRTNGQIKRLIEEYNSKTSDKYRDLVKDLVRLAAKKSDLKIMFEAVTRCDRPQTLDTNYERVKEDVDILVARKGKFGSKDKDVVATILAKNSLAHIKQVSEKFGTYSEKSFETVLKDVFGNNSPSYHVAEAIYLTATNRFQYWCRLLKQSMTGVTTNHSLLIRVLITRSEIDLGEINNEFSRKPEWGNGKTLKQWICDKSKGSFQHLLLGIAGLQGYNNDDDNKLDSEASVDTSIESNGNLIGGPSISGVLNDRGPVGIDMPSETDYKVKIISQASISAVPPQDGLNDDSMVSFGGESTINTLNYNDPSQHGNAAAKTPREPEQVDIGDMGAFMLKKMTNKTVSKLWSHIDEDDSGGIEADEVLSLMTFTAVLYDAYKNRVNGNKNNVKLNKPKIRMHLAPLCNWIETTKMVNEHKKVGKEEFTKLFGAWLKEYAQNHPQ